MATLSRPSCERSSARLRAGSRAASSPPTAAASRTTSPSAARNASFGRLRSCAKPTTRTCATHAASVLAEQSRQLQTPSSACRPTDSRTAAACQTTPRSRPSARRVASTASQLQSSSSRRARSKVSKSSAPLSRPTPTLVASTSETSCARRSPAGSRYSTRSTNCVTPTKTRTSRSSSTSCCALAQRHPVLLDADSPARRHRARPQHGGAPAAAHLLRDPRQGKRHAHRGARPRLGGGAALGGERWLKHWRARRRRRRVLRRRLPRRLAITT